ncbi:MAG: hypothetical protein ACYC1Y_00685 [Minisyncoccota bacterium]
MDETTITPEGTEEVQAPVAPEAMPEMPATPETTGEEEAAA